MGSMRQASARLKMGLTLTDNDPLGSGPNSNGTQEHPIVEVVEGLYASSSATPNVIPVRFHNPVVLVHGFWGGSCVSPSCISTLGMCDGDGRTFEDMYPSMIEAGFPTFVASGLDPCGEHEPNAGALAAL